MKSTKGILEDNWWCRSPVFGGEWERLRVDLKG